jgi:hypothetical protein
MCTLPVGLADVRCTAHSPEARPLFPVARWLGLLWLAVFVPSYAIANGPLSFLFLCDISVFLVVLGLWRGSALLLSSQAVGCLLVCVLWDVDLVSRLLTGRHLIGGTEYMWDAHKPLFARLLSGFHAALPIVTLFALRRTGYDPRGRWLQSAIAVAAVTAGRLVGEQANVNFAFRDPIFKHAWSPAALHVAVVAGALVLVAYPLTHALLSRVFPRRADCSRRRLL